jgi:hypothetical protein
MDRTRTHIFARLVNPFNVALDLLALIFNAQLFDVTGSTLVWFS